MQQEKILTSKEIIVIGSMLFALFLGAGNMIFPPMLGQEAGTNIWLALAGFLVTGVGLPLLAVVAIARSGGDLQTLATRVHPIYGVVFTIIVYLAIGPLFGIPRTGTVAYEIGITPFIPDDLAEKRMPLFIFTILYFGITIWLSLSKESIPLMDADHIFMFNSDETAKDAELTKKTKKDWTSSNQWKNLKAVKNDNVSDNVDEITWNMAGGYKSSLKLIDDLYEKLDIKKQS